jgi:hypothetical protein
MQTAQALSYTSLFDLPAFDTATLARVTTLTLSLSNTGSSSQTSIHSGYEATFSISGAIKQHGARACTLFTPDGSEIRIDAASNLAMAQASNASSVPQAPRPT